MSNRLNDLHNTRHEGMLDFMRDLEVAGFDNELDNGRVMNTLSEKINEVFSKVQREGSYFITSEVKAHPAHKQQLVVTIHSTISKDVVADAILFVRPERNSIAISRDVMSEGFKAEGSDLPFSGAMLTYTEALKYITDSKRFASYMPIIFKSVHDAVASTQDSDKCMIRLTPLPSGIDVKYMIGGKKVTRLLVEYNH